MPQRLFGIYTPGHPVIQRAYGSQPMLKTQDLNVSQNVGPLKTGVLPSGYLYGPSLDMGTLENRLTHVLLKRYPPLLHLFQYPVGLCSNTSRGFSGGLIHSPLGLRILWEWLASKAQSNPIGGAKSPIDYLTWFPVGSSISLARRDLCHVHLGVSQTLPPFFVFFLGGRLKLAPFLTNYQSHPPKC